MKNKLKISGIVVIVVLAIYGRVSVVKEEKQHILEIEKTIKEIKEDHKKFQEDFLKSNLK